MDFRFFFGPDKPPFLLLENNVAEAESGTPFHGIISRGLLNAFEKHVLAFSLWYENAHRLDPNNADTGSDPEPVATLRKLATQCGVLSFGQSALCAMTFATNLRQDLASEVIDRCEIWNLKEGHTSSVWKVSLFGLRSPEHVFIVNVARDREAGAELERTSEQMKAIAELHTDINIAKVHDIQKISIGPGALSGVVVTGNEWIENSFEVHTITDKVKEREQYILVERFLTGSKDTPAQITSIQGRRFSEQESARIRTDIDLFMQRAGSSTAVRIDINNGDVVWNGEKAVVVAVC